VATHREILYARVPEGTPDASCFRLVEAPLPRPADGFRIGSHGARRGQALDQLLDCYRPGRLKFHETVAQGLEVAPAALINVLSGGNIGKQVVRLATATE
jgi:NADPH-dependent curcumin reductase CurA